MEFRRKRRWLTAGLLCLVGVFAGCGSELAVMNAVVQNEENAPPPAVAEEPSEELKNRFLDELRKYIDDADDWGDLGADPDKLIDSLKEADEILTRIKKENAVALKNVNRQVPVASPVRSPNVVLIVAPRMSRGDLDLRERASIGTPNLNRMAEEGVTFTDFYSGDLNPAVSQWTLQTGWTVNNYQDKSAWIPPSTETIAKSLWQGGYRTVFNGMWMAPDTATETDSPLYHGYDAWTGQLHAVHAATAYPKSYWVNDQRIDLKQSQDPVSSWELIVQSAVQELNAQATSPRRPLFLTIVLPPYFEMASQVEGRKISVESDWPIAVQGYGAAVRMIDADVGRIRAAIDQAGLTRRTSVFFTALTGNIDQDEAARKHFHGESYLAAENGTLDDRNLRVPFLAVHRNVFPMGAKVHRPAAMWDLQPTLIQHTFTRSIRANLHGSSFAKLLKVPSADVASKILYWETTNSQAVRLGEWKGRRTGAASLELYNLTHDPDESENVAKDHPEVIEQLMAKPPER